MRAGSKVRCVSTQNTVFKENRVLLELGKIYTIAKLMHGPASGISVVTLEEINQVHTRRPYYDLRDFEEVVCTDALYDFENAWDRAFKGM